MSEVAMGGRSLAKLETPTVDFDRGLYFALTGLDGAVALGLGRLSLDRRQFNSAFELCSPDVEKLEEEQKAAAIRQCLAPSDFRDSFWFFSLQPLSSARAAIKNQKEPNQGPGN